MTKRIIISEKYENLLLENVLMEELPKSLIKALDNNKTSLGKHPAFPPEEENNFDSKLTINQFKEVRDRLLKYNDFQDLSEDNLTKELILLVKKCQKIEKPNKDILEKLCCEVVIDMFQSPNDLFNLTCEIKDYITQDNNELKLTPEDKDNENSYEFDNIENMELLNQEVYKRRLINALVIGSSMYYSNLMIKTRIQDLFEIDPRLPELYHKIISINDYLLFTKNELVISDKKQMQGGTVKVVLGNVATKSSINAEGLIFPILLSEVIKGFMEMFAANGLPKKKEEALYVINKADFLLAEPWDMRIGPALWKRLLDNFNEEERDKTNIIPHVFTNLVQLSVAEFNSYFQEIFGKTKLGKQIINDMMQSIEANNQYNEFEDNLEKKRNDIGLISEDDFIDIDDPLLNSANSDIHDTIKNY